MLLEDTEDIELHIECSGTGYVKDGGDPAWKASQERRVFHAASDRDVIFR